MPHLLIERLRTTPVWVAESSCLGRTGSGAASRSKHSPVCAIVVELADILGGLIFVFGSVCFLPSKAADIQVLKLGCELFIVGSVVYALVSLYALLESTQVHGSWGLEFFENLLYVFGSFAFLLGTLLFWPRGDDEPQQVTSLIHHPTWEAVVLLNAGDEAFQGSLLCIAGCIFFAFAAFINGLNIRHFNDLSSQLLSAVTSIYMCGSLLFVMGSVAFLPGFGCSSKMVLFGAGLYIAGSLLYTGGSIISLFRTVREINTPEWHPEDIDVARARLWCEEDAFGSYGMPRRHSK